MNLSRPATAANDIFRDGADGGGDTSGAADGGPTRGPLLRLDRVRFARRAPGCLGQLDDLVLLTVLILDEPWCADGLRLAALGDRVGPHRPREDDPQGFRLLSAELADRPAHVVLEGDLQVWSAVRWLGRQPVDERLLDEIAVLVDDPLQRASHPWESGSAFPFGALQPCDAQAGHPLRPQDHSVLLHPRRLPKRHVAPDVVHVS